MKLNNRPVRTAFLGLLVALSGSAILPVITATPAVAGCSQFGNWHMSTYNSNGTVKVAHEQAQSSATCDSDNWYAGDLHDPVSDGRCAFSYIEDSGYAAQHAYECVTLGWEKYTFVDTNGNRNSYLWPNNEVYWQRYTNSYY